MAFRCDCACRLQRRILLVAIYHALCKVSQCERVIVWLPIVVRVPSIASGSVAVFV